MYGDPVSRLPSAPGASVALLALLAGACALGPVRTDPASRAVDGVTFHVDSRPESLLAVVHVRNDAADEVRVTRVRYLASGTPHAPATLLPWGRVLAPGEQDSVRLDMDSRWPPGNLGVTVEWERIIRSRVPRKRETGPPSSVVDKPPVTDPVPR